MEGQTNSIFSYRIFDTSLCVTSSGSKNKTRVLIKDTKNNVLKCLLNYLSQTCVLPPPLLHSDGTHKVLTFFPYTNIWSVAIGPFGCTCSEVFVPSPSLSLSPLFLTFSSRTENERQRTSQAQHGESTRDRLGTRTDHRKGIGMDADVRKSGDGE